MPLKTPAGPGAPLECTKGADMERQRKLDLESSLIATLISSELAEAVADVLEVAVDAALIEGVAKEIPIIGTIVSIGKTLGSVRDYFLMRKVLLFLKGVSETSGKERQALVRKVEGDSKYQQRVGETIMILLDRYDHLDKASLMSTVLCGCIRGKITYTEFLRISTSIDRAFIDDLNELLHYFASEEIDRELQSRRNRTTRNLYSSDLSNFYVLTEEEARRGGREHPQVYHFNQYACKLAEVVLGDRFHGDRW